MLRVKRSPAAAALPCVLALLLSACGGGDSGPAATTPVISGDVSIKTLSNRPDMISDGDAYVEVVLPSGATVSDLKVDIDGNDVTSSFAQRPNGRVLGVITGLKNGTSTISATLKSVNKGARLAVTNYDRGGPIFSGPQIEPWICATKAGSPVLVQVPGTALSATVTTRTSGLECGPRRKVQRTREIHLLLPAEGPAGNGLHSRHHWREPVLRRLRSRVKTGRHCDRRLHERSRRQCQEHAAARARDGRPRRVFRADLLRPGAALDALAAAKGLEWQALWKFGASASGNRFQQSPGASVFDANALAAGFMTVNAQLTNHNDNNNEFLAAEATMMLKEHIIDTYGEIRYTMSDGLSGGSMMQTVIASVMPGLLQGIQPAWSYPDAVSTWMETRECGLLGQFYQTATAAR